MSAKIPKSLQDLFSDVANDNEESPATVDSELQDEAEGEGEGSKVTGEKAEVQMNWNICKYLPQAGSCQDLFQVGGQALRG